MSTDTELDKPEISFTDPKVQQCPFEAYNRLRAECPVYKDPVSGNYVLTQYRDVRKALMQVRSFSSKGVEDRFRSNPNLAALFAEKGWPHLASFQAMDPPEHKAKRSLVDKAFSRWNVEAIHPMIQSIVDELIDKFEPNGKCEFVREFSMPLTMKVIASQLGVPFDDPEQFERDAKNLHLWSDCLVDALAPVLPPERERELALHHIDFQHFCAANIRRVHANPDSSLLSKIVEAMQDEEGEPNLPEVLAISRSLLVAGNETTRFALTAGVKALIDDPELAQRLRDEPERIAAFTEEVVRTMSPVQTLFRRATEDVELGGTIIPQGARVEMRYGAANRDPEVFDQPEKIDLERSGDQQHLAFGAGIHVCIGMQLARAELHIAFRRLLERLDNLRPANGEDSYEYSPIYISWGLTKLDLAFDVRT